MPKFFDDSNSTPRFKDENPEKASLMIYIAVYFHALNGNVITPGGLLLRHGHILTGYEIENRDMRSLLMTPHFHT